ncbi:MAG TPA: non-heme iron oxygenase ferredoxin subunit [Xanthobacteraceae bacterium]
MSQEKWLSVAARDALEEGAMMPIEAGGLSIALYNIAGEIYATDNICTHAFATLTDGCLDGDVIECRLHGGTFEVKTGKGLGDPISEDLKTYPVRVVGDMIEVRVA